MRERFLDEVPPYLFWAAAVALNVMVPPLLPQELLTFYQGLRRLRTARVQQYLTEQWIEIKRTAQATAACIEQIYQQHIHVPYAAFRRPNFYNVIRAGVYFSLLSEFIFSFTRHETSSGTSPLEFTLALCYCKPLKLLSKFPLAPLFLLTLSVTASQIANHIDNLRLSSMATVRNIRRAFSQNNFATIFTPNLIPLFSAFLTFKIMLFDLTCNWEGWKAEYQRDGLDVIHEYAYTTILVMSVTCALLEETNRMRKNVYEFCKSALFPPRAPTYTLEQLDKVGRDELQCPLLKTFPDEDLAVVISDKRSTPQLFSRDVLEEWIQSNGNKLTKKVPHPVTHDPDDQIGLANIFPAPAELLEKLRVARAKEEANKEPIIEAFTLK